MKRRTALVGGVGVAGAVVGASVSLWQLRRRPSPVEVALWAMAFDKPSGGRLTLTSFRGQPLLLNFWATWCPPCVAELPMLDRFYRQQPSGGLRVAGLAVDAPDPVREFLSARPVAFDIGIAGAAGIVLARDLGNAGGGLPFTAVFDGQGRLVHRKLGVVAPSDLETWARSV